MPQNKSTLFFCGAVEYIHIAVVRPFRSLRQWASGAAFHAQMLVHLAGLEGHAEPLAARAALDQYKEDLAQIIPAYR